MTGPEREARCRHCGRIITPHLQWWMSADGFYACAKGPVYHQPMPDGLDGAIRLVMPGDEVTP